ncbi:hypothetical protein BH11PSE14_BH11PSE14_15930 [soil metagenome]
MFALALVLIMAVGFAAHRASLCTVRAVAEVLDHGSAHMLASFLKAAAWTALVSGLLVFAMQGSLYPATQRAPYWLALAGGLLFGVGAGVNGSCALSTMQRLADGEVTMLATLLAFVGGLLAWLSWIEPLSGHLTRALPVRLAPGMPWAPVLLAVLSVWGVWEAVQVWRIEHGDSHGPPQSAPPSMPPLFAPPPQAPPPQAPPPDPTARNVHPVLRDRWSLPAAALVMGVAGGLLYTLQGGWTYTNFLRGEATAWLGQGMSPGALLVGMGLSSWQRRSFALRLPPMPVLMRSLAGGLLMGLGAAILPGGNDTLVLIAIPTLAPNALGVYAAVLAGATLTLLLLRGGRRVGVN